LSNTILDEDGADVVINRLTVEKEIPCNEEAWRKWMNEKVKND